MTLEKREARGNRRLISSYVGILILIAGLSLAFFPYLTNAYTRYFLANPADEEIVILLENERTEEDTELPFYLQPEEQKSDEPDEQEPQVEYPDSLPSGAGVLRIAALDLLLNVGHGVKLSDLRAGPGFYPQSGSPDAGNVAIAGHRTTYGAPFRYVDKLKAGDEIILYYGEKIYVYSVESVFETHTRDWSVIDPTPKPALTLTTCHPPGWATKRLVVRAGLEGTSIQER